MSVHCWMNVSPATVDDYDEHAPVGVQVLLHAKDSDSMVKQVDHRLAAFGARTADPIKDTRGENQEFELLEIEDKNRAPANRLPVGLIVRLFPCTAEGVNHDRGGADEPRGE